VEDHRQEAWARPSTGDDVEGRGRLADLLAVATGELLAYGLDHLPLPGDRLQGAGHVLAELAKPAAAAARTRRRRIDHHARSGQMIGKGGPRLRTLADEGRPGQ